MALCNQKLSVVHLRRIHVCQPSILNLQRDWLKYLQMMFWCCLEGTKILEDEKGLAE